MKTSRIERLLADANPVTTPAPGQVTPAQERIRAAILAGAASAPPRTRRRRPAGILVAASIAVAAVLAGAYAVARDAGVRDEVEATTSTVDGGTAAGGMVIHSVTRMYGTLYGPGLAERSDGWLEPATGRARLVVTTGDETTLQQATDAEGVLFRSWQGAPGNAGDLREDQRSPRLVENLRARVRDPIGALVDSARAAFRRDGATVGAGTEKLGEYRGRAAVVHRVEPTVGGRPSGSFFRWYTDTGNGGEPIAFERGTVDAAGREVVEQGEELVTLEPISAEEAATHLEWVEPPPSPGELPAAPATTPTPAPSSPPTLVPTASPTPAPASPSALVPTASPTPAPRR